MPLIDDLQQSSSIRVPTLLYFHEHCKKYKWEHFQEGISYTQIFIFEGILISELISDFIREMGVIINFITIIFLTYHLMGKIRW